MSGGSMMWSSTLIRIMSSLFKTVSFRGSPPQRESWKYDE
jgi:hypothetical protein